MGRGGSGPDEGWDLAVDGAGNVYVVGDTTASDFPATPGAYDATHNGNYDGFVAKLAPGGDRLLWATFLGGSAYEYGRAIAVDNSGVYVAGRAPADAVGRRLGGQRRHGPGHRARRAGQVGPLPAAGAA